MLLIVLGGIVLIGVAAWVAQVRASKMDARIRRGIEESKALHRGPRSECAHPYVAYWRNNSVGGQIFGLKFSDCLICGTSSPKRGPGTTCVGKQGGLYYEIPNPDRK